MTASLSDSVLLSDASRRIKRRGVLLAAIGYAIGLALLWLCRRLDFTDVSMGSLLLCASLFAANTLFLYLLLHFRLDEKLKFDPHFIYTPVFTSIPLMTYFLYIAGDSRGLLFAVLFLPFVFMVNFVGFRDGLVISSLFVIAYLTMLFYNLRKNEMIETQAEGVRVTVFFTVMLFICLVMERSKRQRQRHIAILKEVSALQEMGKTLVSTLVVDKLVDQILSVVKEKFGYVNCSLWTVESDSQELLLRAQKGFTSPEGAEPARLPLAGPGITVWAANHGELVNVKEVQKDTRYVTADLLPDSRIASEIALPLKRQGEVFAVLDVQSERVNGFGKNDERVLGAVADYASIALANARWVDEIHDRANRDGLTRLYNHRFLLEQLEIELHRAGRLGYSCSFIMADIDHFKSINDTQGHQNGDEVLKQLSALLSSSLRAVDVVGRYGGEEFSIILLNVPPREALLVAEKLRRKVEENLFLDMNGRPLLRATMSFGVASFPQDARSSANLVRAADERLYQAKQSGRNRVFPSAQ